jgi:hypothetical protein
MLPSQVHSFRCSINSVRRFLWARTCSEANAVLKRMPLMFCIALLMGASAAAFDGGGFDQVDDDQTDRQRQTEVQPDYISYHALCMEREMRMWGEVAELMADLATAQCHCEYTELEQAGAFSDAVRESVAAGCARRGSRDKKEAFIQWALPRHQQRMNAD